MGKFPKQNFTESSFEITAGSQIKTRILWRLVSCELSMLLAALLVFFLGGVVVGVILEKVCSHCSRPPGRVAKASPRSPPAQEYVNDVAEASNDSKVSLPAAFAVNMAPGIFLSRTGTHYHLFETCQALKGRCCQKYSLCGHCAKKYDLEQKKRA